ncbi:alternate-type signal peptide domain-containing protein [Georgenia satyanarayanai]|uniref:alternate-type signal peptide domain-containing protein n=1 Tax=Georgenia satyanarayanai TaxID=860221 RepID=UPI00203BA531|nr:alternate-type signal peptide domain-containing protein [Georgenia satyanarayanai]MCM3660801.1 alternate-type signal peptide domain-containing protein [Georgenia satyanarayanai]
MNKKTTGLVAGAAGAALLMGGATFALWNDSAWVDGGAITAGNLDVSAGAVSWKDVSEDRTQGNHSINLDTFRIVPGDTIQGTLPLKAALQGDNLVAELSLDKLGVTGNEQLLAELAEHATYEVRLDGTTIVDATPLAEAEALRFASADNSQNVAPLPTLPAALTATPNLEVVLTVTFDEDVAGRDLTRAKATLKDFDVALTQVRDAGVDGGF